MNTRHELRTFAVLMTTCAAVLMLSQTAAAKCGHQGHQQMPAYSDLDANGDNAVSPEEFYEFRAKRMAARVAEGRKMKNAQNAPAFEDLDLDGDGSLSAEEFAQHQANCPMKGRKHREGAPQREDTPQ
jgi:hypothetical protein